MTPARSGLLLIMFAAACSSSSGVREPEPRARPTPCVADRSMPPGGTRVNGFTIPAAHPRLWWSSERLESAKTWLAHHPMKPIGDRPAPEELVGVALLHSVTGASCQPAIDWVMDYTIRDAAFEVASDEVRWHGELAILVFDWCHDQLDVERRAVLIDRWNGYLEKSMTSQWGGATMLSNNYFWGYLRNQLEWGIATHGENPAAAKFLANALDTRWRDGFIAFASSKAGAGGVPQEGTQYGGYMLDYPIIPFDTIGMLGRSLYDETEFFKGSVLWLLYATTPAVTTSAVSGVSGYEVFPFNDDQKWNNHGSAKAFINFMTSAAMTWHCKPYGGYSRTWLAQIGEPPAPFLAAVDRGGPTRELGTLPLDYYAPGGGHFFGRTAWTPTATVFHWQFAKAVGVGHAHHDFGSWQIWRNGRWLSRESVGYSDEFTGAGGQGTTPSEHTAAHNGLLVNGKGVADGSDGAPIVRRLESRPEYAYAAVDLSTAYRNHDRGHPGRDNAAVVHVERELVFVRHLETTVILDRLESNASTDTKTFLAHFEQAPTIEAPGRVSYVSGTQALRISVLAPAAPTITVVNEQTPKGKVGQFRLEVTTAGATRSYFLTVLQATDVTTAALQPTLVETASELTVQLDATTSLRFAKGMVARGGTVTIGGTPHPLRADVQTLALTDAGPVWR